MSLGGGAEPPVGEGIFPFRRILCPRRAQLSTPHTSHRLTRNGGAWGHLKVSRTALMAPRAPPGCLAQGSAVSWAAEGRAVPGGLVGVEGTELSKAKERAEPNAISCHSGCSSSSFCFLLNTRFVLFFVWVCICEGEPGKAVSLSATSCSSSSWPSAMGSWSAPGLGLRVPTWNGAWPGGWNGGHVRG